MASLEFEVDSAGLITYDTTDLKDYVDGVFTDSFGEDLDMSSYTEQGALSIGISAMLESLQAKVATLVNIGNVLYATGSSLDAIALAYGYERKKEYYGSVVVTFLGLTGTVIPSGFIVSSDDIEYTTNNALVLADGYGTVSATATTYSSEVIFPNTVTNMEYAITGIDSVTNTSYGTSGSETETDESLKLRMGNTGYAGRTLSLPESCLARISNLSGVLSTSFAENKTETTKTVDEISLARHSMIICVDGGTDSEIAQQIAISESQGCTYVGNTTVTYLSEDSERPVSFEYLIQRPTYVPLEINITVTVTDDFAKASAESDVKTAIMQYLDNTKLILNATLTTADLASAISNLSNIYFGGGNFTYKDEEEVLSASCYINEVFSISSDDITVEIV